MKTVEVFKDTNNGPKNINLKMKKGLKTEAFGDKENVTDKCQPSVVSECSKTDVVGLTKEKPKRVATSDVHDEKKKLLENAYAEKCSVAADDLTKSVPSEQYWKTLAEQQREALKSSLEENEILHVKINLLMEENETLKQALQEASEVIDELNEIVKESNFDNANEKNDSDETGNSGSERTTDAAQSIPSFSKKSSEPFGNDSTVISDSDESDD